MDPSNELAIEAQDAREWELSDEELDRQHGPARLCPVTAIPPTIMCAR